MSVRFLDPNVGIGLFLKECAIGNVSQCGWPPFFGSSGPFPLVLFENLIPRRGT